MTAKHGVYLPVTTQAVHMQWAPTWMRPTPTIARATLATIRAAVNTPTTTRHR